MTVNVPFEADDPNDLYEGYPYWGYWIGYDLVN